MMNPTTLPVLYVWLGEDEAGNEQIGMVDDLPLITHDQYLAERMRHIAEEAASQGHVKAKLVRFMREQ